MRIFVASPHAVAMEFDLFGERQSGHWVRTQSNPRSGCQHKARGVSPGYTLEKLTKPAERATASTLDVSFVVFNSIRFQEFNKLIVKRNLAVMLLLFSNISSHLVDL